MKLHFLIFFLIFPFITFPTEECIKNLVEIGEFKENYQNDVSPTIEKIKEGFLKIKFSDIDPEISLLFEEPFFLEIIKQMRKRNFYSKDFSNKKQQSLAELEKKEFFNVNQYINTKFKNILLKIQEAVLNLKTNHQWTLGGKKFKEKSSEHSEKLLRGYTKITSAKIAQDSGVGTYFYYLLFLANTHFDDDLNLKQRSLIDTLFLSLQDKEKMKKTINRIAADINKTSSFITEELKWTNFKYSFLVFDHPTINSFLKARSSGVFSKLSNINSLLDSTLDSFWEDFEEKLIEEVYILREGILKGFFYNNAKAYHPFDTLVHIETFLSTPENQFRQILISYLYLNFFDPDLKVFLPFHQTNEFYLKEYDQNANIEGFDIYILSQHHKKDRKLSEIQLAYSANSENGSLYNFERFFYHYQNHTFFRTSYEQAKKQSITHKILVSIFRSYLGSGHIGKPMDSAVQYNAPKTKKTPSCLTGNSIFFMENKAFKAITLNQLKKLYKEYKKEIVLINDSFKFLDSYFENSEAKVLTKEMIKERIKKLENVKRNRDY